MRKIVFRILVIKLCILNSGRNYKLSEVSVIVLNYFLLKINDFNSLCVNFYEMI